MKHFFYISILLTLFSCNNKEKDVVYFGGKIINPKSKYVILKNANKVIDTLILDKNNHFLKKFDSISEGLYTFFHDVEFQYVYIEPNDSIIIHLNTWDFDKSLVFSGKGSKKNEFLLDIFLHDEHIISEINPYLSEEEPIFQTKIDSLLDDRKMLYQEFLNNETNSTNNFLEIAHTAIYYPIYRLKELYPMYYQNINRKPPKISGKYYSFRKDVDFGKESLADFYSYQNYAISYIYNVGFLKQQLQPNTPLCYHFLETIADDISSKKLSNELLYKYMVTDFFDEKPYGIAESSTLELFYEKCSDPTLIEKLTNLLNDCKKTPSNKKITDFSIMNYENKLFSIQELIQKKRAVLYFWSEKTTSPYYLVNRIRYLEKQFPNILFLGINTNPEFNIHTSEKGYSRLPISRQFKLTKGSDAFQFLKSGLPRVILLKKDGIVSTQFISLSNGNLQNELATLARE